MTRGIEANPKKTQFIKKWRYGFEQLGLGLKAYLNFWHFPEKWMYGLRRLGLGLGVSQFLPLC